MCSSVHIFRAQVNQFTAFPGINLLSIKLRNRKTSLIMVFLGKASKESSEGFPGMGGWGKGYQMPPPWKIGLMVSFHEEQH